MERILEILEKNAKATPEEIALMLGISPAEAAAQIKKLEEENVIIGYKTLINWDKTKRPYVSAFIELRVTPQHNEGFDRIAERIYQFEQVRSVYLMSGSFDLAVIVEGKAMKEVALFVAEKLAPMPCIVSTSTHFVLKKYKDDGILFENQRPDEREMITL